MDSNPSSPRFKFKIDVSRRFKNKTGYEHGGTLNTSFRTEEHTPQTLIDDVITPGWPYTMAHMKRSPQATGADKRGCKTPKHIENFVSMQVATFDDDSGEGDVVGYWLNDQFFKSHGWAFVESASSTPQRQKGHPTFIFDEPVTDPKLYKEILQAFCTAYPRLDWLVNIDRTIYNGEGATIHKLGNICPLDLFVREIVEPWRAEEARKLSAIEAEQARQRAEWEKLKARGRQVSGSLEAAWLSGWLNWLFDRVANTRSGGNPSRNGAIYWAGRAVAGAIKSPWTAPHVHLFCDVEQRIVKAATVNGYLADYARGNDREILRIFERGRAAGGQALEEPRPTRAIPETKFADPEEQGTILQMIAELRAERDREWIRNPTDEPPDVYERIKNIFRKSGQLDKEQIETALQAVERPPSPLAMKCRTDLRKVWEAARKFANADGVFVVRPDRPETYPYDVKGGRIVYLSERMLYDVVTVNAQVVADFEARIVSQITDEDGTRHFAIKGKAIRGGPFGFEIDAEDFGNERKLRAVADAASGALDPVRAGMGKHLPPALQLLSGDGLTQLRRYTRTGWIDGRFLIPGREPDGVVVELGTKLPFGISKTADLQHGLSALEALLESMTPERATVVASLMFQAPLSRLAGWDNERYALFISGRTGSFKTSFAQVLMCIYGERFAGDDMLVKWGEGATANAMMHIATQAHHMPVLLDNFKPSTGGGARAFISTIHNILEGGEKDRLTRGSTLRDTKPIYCWPLCTGEDVPDTDPASLARILIVPFEWQRGTDNENLTKAQQFAHHLPAIGGAWLDWLETNEAQETITRITAQFPAYRSRWATTLRKMREDSVNILRVASNLATNELTWEVLQQHPTIGDLARRMADAHMRGLTDIVAAAMSTATAEALEATRYIAALKELLATGVSEVIGLDADTNDRTIGYYDAGGVYLLTKTARQAVEKLLGDDLNGVSQSAIHSQLDALGIVARRGNRSWLIAKKVRGKSVKVLHLLPDALEESEDGEPEQIPF